MSDERRVRVGTGQSASTTVVRQRLRTLLELAIAIGQRQGLLGDGRVMEMEIRPQLGDNEATDDHKPGTGHTALEEAGLPSKGKTDDNG